MKSLRLHRWNVTPKQAIVIQLRLRDRIEPHDRFGKIQKIAGADVSLDLRRQLAIAGVIVYTFPDLVEVERAFAVRPLRFPYVPGLLSFREIPVLLAAFRKIRNAPDLIFCDGQGYAHPRRFGMASHLGVLLDCPTVGCAKSVLVGKAPEPGRQFGSKASLEDNGEKIGVALRLKTDAKPIYISIGHRASLKSAVGYVIAVSDGYKVPKPTRKADRFVAVAKSYRQAPHPHVSNKREAKPEGFASRGGWGLLPITQQEF